MKKALRLLICLFLLSALTIPVYAASSVPSAVIKAVDSVVRIEAEFADGWATGSGFVIESSRDTTLIATNYHVVEGNPQNISVWLGEDESIRAEIVLQSESKDLCILKLAYPVSLKALRFDEAGLGEAIYAVGFPAAADDLSDKAAHDSRDATLTDGIVSALRSVTITEGGSPVAILQINAAINSGNSGGPLFNEKGRVVGINTYGITDAQGIFGAIAVSELEGLLAQSGIRLGGGMDWLRPVGIGAAALLVLAGMIALLKKCRPLPVKKLAVGALVVLLLLAVGGYAGTYLIARSAAAEGEFEKAGELLLLRPLTAMHDGDLVDYVTAGEALSAGDYAGAKEAFAALSGYMEADTMVLEADYRYAEDLLAAGEFDEAAIIFSGLNEIGYSDSLEKFVNAKYKKGLCLLDCGDYAAADAVFSLLLHSYVTIDDEEYREIRFQQAISEWGKERYAAAYDAFKEIEDYPKVEEVFLAFVDEMYNKGVDLYRERTPTAFINAKSIFTKLEGYLDANKYLFLIEAQNTNPSTSLNPNVKLKDLMDIFYFEDTSVLITAYKLDAFLRGVWYGSGHTFSLTVKDEVNTDIPGYEGVKDYETFWITRLLKRNKLDITALSPDCIEIYCHQNGQTYTLYRQ